MIKIKKIIKHQFDYYSLFVILFWLKTYFSYQAEFNLGVTGPLQQFILVINPIGIAMLLFSLSLFSKDSRRSQKILLSLLVLASIVLYANILYYREFSDFLTTTILVGSNNLSGGLIASTIAMMRPWDILYWLDVLLLSHLLIKNRPSLMREKQSVKVRSVKPVLIIGAAFLLGNITLAEISRPQLLTRTFDRNYIVKYLGINFFTGYDVVHTLKNTQIRALADESDINEIIKFTKENHAEPNPEYFGVAEDRNVIVISLESVQQFLIDFELEDENGELHEVMPFVNSLFHSESSYSFENFFHQTSQGKSSDAEVLGETSLYGLPQGSAFQSLGSTNTFHAAPNILKETAGYTTAAFHGNVGSFWNRTDTYNAFGYDYFFDSEFYDLSEDRALEYGLKDKLFFRDSVEYLEQLPQPFYTKFVTVTHHFPFPLDDQNAGFPLAQTDDNTVNDFFATANYADQAIEEFFNYLKSSGLYDNSIIMLYGDHYGVSNMRNPHLAPLVGEDAEEWGEFQNAQIQRVPLIMHVPGVENGQVSDTYSGQVDMLPTLMHLLGLQTDDYLFMGQDILSDEHNNKVPLRNGRVITPDYTFISDSIYDTDTGELISESMSEDEYNKLIDQRNRAREELTYSDNLLSMDLLRFYTPEPFRDIQKNDYLYTNQLEVLEANPLRDTSLLQENDGVSSLYLYETDAPELKGTPQNLYNSTSQPTQLTD
ncbi:MAG: LTA synthase family protein [Alkalibacterium sp.]|nr:LTA synthase family protein [Alkalibacterium sp.]